MTFTLTLTALGDRRRHHLRHAARADAAVALKRLSRAGGRLRQPDALDSAGAGDLLVLFPGAATSAHGSSVRPADPGRRLPSSLITFTMFEAAYYSEIMRAGIQSVPRGQVQAGYALGMTYCADACADRAAAGVPQHAAGAADADDHPVPGHVAGLRDRRHRFPRSGVEDRRQERQPAWSRCTCSPRSSISSSASPLSMLVRRLQTKIASSLQ